MVHHIFSIIYILIGKPENKSSAGYELAGTNFQICSQPLTFKDAPIISKTGDVESLGDGSSTIPYGSLTQRMLMDQAIADPNPQLELSTWGDTRSNDIVEDNSLPSPLSSPCTQQVRYKLLLFSHIDKLINHIEISERRDTITHCQFSTKHGYWV